MWRCIREDDCQSSCNLHVFLQILTPNYAVETHEMHVGTFGRVRSWCGRDQIWCYTSQKQEGLLHTFLWSLQNFALSIPNRGSLVQRFCVVRLMKWQVLAWKTCSEKEWEPVHFSFVTKRHASSIVTRKSSQPDWNGWLGIAFGRPTTGHTQASESSSVEMSLQLARVDLDCWLPSEAWTKGNRLSHVF